jgi:glycosyltransferase involved in cell wall biosynthesis
VIEKLGEGNLAPKIPNWANAQISFKPEILDKFNPSTQKIAILASNEFEGFSKNGGIGTYYTTLSQKLATDGWTIVLLLCQTDIQFQGEPPSQTVHHVFSIHEINQVLNLQPIHQQILSATQKTDLGNSFDYQSFCCSFFIQAIAATVQDAVIYAEFPEIWGFGYRTIQAKQSGFLGTNCLIGVTSHGTFEWLQEVNSRYHTEQPNWLWQAYHYEQFSYENANITYSPSHFLKSKLSSYGWKTDHAKHLPYFLPSLNLEPDAPTPEKMKKIPIVFFGRLEERKGLCTLLDAVQLLDSAIADSIHIIFIGKIIPLQSSHLQHLNSQQYIDRELTDSCTYTLLSDLSSQEAIQSIADLHCPIVCLTSLQENFPNAALEMGQLAVALVVSDTGGFRETLDLLHRSDALHWFQPGSSDALAQALINAIRAYPEQPIPLKQTAIKSINRHLLNQRLEFMSQAFLEVAPTETTPSSVTITVVCQHSATTLLECLKSLAAQTYDLYDVIVISPANDSSIQATIVQAQTQFPNYKYLTSEAHWSLGETYNYLVDHCTGEYVLLFSSPPIAMPIMIETMITAACEAKATAVVCPQQIEETITLMDGNLLKLLEFNHHHDLTALFSKTLLKTYPYAQARGLQALNWQIFAAAIATNQAIVYYPYPLYTLCPNASSTIPAANFAKERYYLRQFLFQIQPEQWNQRQINVLLTGFEHLIQSPRHSQPLSSSPQDQAWMLTAQQMQQELTQAQARLRELEHWNQELQTGKDWLESQWQNWMLTAQKLEGKAEQMRSLIQQIQSSRFWQLRIVWLKLKRKFGNISPDPLQPAAQASTPGVQEFVSRIAGQKNRFFQPAATQAPVVTIVSSCVGENQFLETMYRSIINQTLQNFEWLIVDDGSTDSETHTLLTALSHRTAKIRVMTHKTHRGMAASYNTAIAQANGEYLCFVEISSLLDPTYLEKCVLFLETHPKVSLVNSYSIVFQAQEHWWNSHLKQPASLFQQNGLISYPVYRKTDFNRLGGFDESLSKFADWERCLNAIAQRQIGWTIPEYLACYRSTTHDHHSVQHQTLEIIRSRYRTIFDHPPETTLEPQPLKLDSLNFRLNLENQHNRSNPGQRILLFCEALDHSDIAQWNCDWIIWLAQCGYAVTIATTSISNHSCQEFFDRTTPDIFHLPNLCDPVHWLVLIRYLLTSRQIDSLFISGSDVIYPFLPLLRLEFPKVAFIDYIHPTREQSDRSLTSYQFAEDLDCHIVSSQRLAKAYRSLNSHSNIKVCYTYADMKTTLTEVIRTCQTNLQTNPLLESEPEALLLILESLQMITEQK